LKKKAERVIIGLGIEGVEEAAKSECLIIVVDVLRASSTIITAIANGALSIIPTLKIQEAGSIAKSIPKSLLGGERKGVRIPGFDLGNSPLEYTSNVVYNRNIVFTTTNCTRVLEKCKQLPLLNEVRIGAFLNVGALVKEAKRYLDEEEGHISIVQAGSHGKASLDDLLCAEIIKTMIQSEGEHRPTADMRRILSSISYLVLSNTKHGKYLSEIGFDNDVRYCSQIDTTDVVPRFEKEGGTISRIVSCSAKTTKQQN
jgi:2-phosphosulfolactate phosphatase